VWLLKNDDCDWHFPGISHTAQMKAAKSEFLTRSMVFIF
jgi:hypothetical protein